MVVPETGATSASNSKKHISRKKKRSQQDTMKLSGDPELVQIWSGRTLVLQDMKEWAEVFGNVPLTSALSRL